MRVGVSVTADPWLDRIRRHAIAYRAACQTGDREQARAQFLGVLASLWDMDFPGLLVLWNDHFGPARNGATVAPPDAAPPNDSGG